MGYQNLEIKLLSGSGELLNCVNCYAGQVSVFRAYSPSALKPYQRALAGLPGPERFSLTLDAQPYNPEEHIFIGFGERFAAEFGNLTVSEFLTQAGAPSNGVYSLLVSYSMEKFAQSECGTLPACEERRLRILAATYSKDKLVVLNDPFEPVSSHWRERFAELLSNYARATKSVVIVTSLSYRPECWIDNESIARIQVGDNIQKTIGFSSGPSSASNLITQIRNDLKSPESAPIAAGGAGLLSSVSRPVPIRKPAQESNSPNGTSESVQESAAQRFALPKWASTPLVIAVAVGAIMTGLILGSRIMPTHSKEDKVALVPPTEEPVQAALAPTAIPLPPTLPPPPPTEVPKPPTPEPVVERPQEPPAVEVAAVKPDLVLALYPEPIRRSVIESFEGNLAFLKDSSSKEPRAPRVSKSATSKEAISPKAPASSKQAVDLLNVLQSASGSGDGLPDEIRPVTAPQFSQPDIGETAQMSPEQRREAIRQKFLEAIQRAADRR